MDRAVQAVWLDRDAVTVRGPDATGYLQGQLSQDIAAIGDGTSAWSWILEPAGKVAALVRVTGLGGGDWLVDVDGGYGPALITRLNRFKLRTKVDIEAQEWRCLGWRGPRPALDTAIAPVAAATGPAGISPVPADATWGDVSGVDLFGPDLAIPDGVRVLEADEYERVRILAGIPKMGAELTERTIPAETGLVEGTVSFTKGCYTGQELVARIDSRGSHVPRRLRGLRLSGPVEAGSELFLDSRPVGAVTSVAPGPNDAEAEAGWVGLGYLGRAVEPPAVVRDAQGREVTVVELPAGP